MTAARKDNLITSKKEKFTNAREGVVAGERLRNRG